MSSRRRSPDTVKADNEGRCLDAIVRLIEERRHASRSDLCRPELGGSGAPVDLVCRIGREGYALEHTWLQAYVEDASDSAAFQRFIVPLEARLTGRLPIPGHYDLVFPIDAGRRLPVGKHRAAAIRAIENWVLEIAPELTFERPGNSVSAQPIRVPFFVELQRHSYFPDWAGKLFVKRWGPTSFDSDRFRKLVLRNAFDRKCPKLNKSRSSGWTTVLVLELDNIALSEPTAVLNDLRPIAQDFASIPDEIYLVETEMDNEWLIWPVKIESWVETIPGSLRRVNPDNLSSI